ncbi:MAG: response regulator transcription factor [Actinomycetota bacterium]|nr:response regulator transcription factor [Actinomycetota bacterium]
MDGDIATTEPGIGGPPALSAGVAAKDRELLALAVRLLAEDGFTVSGSTSGAGELIAACAERAPDAVVLAGDLDGSQRVNEIRRLREGLPKSVVVIAATARDGNGVRSALRAGATGFALISRLATTLALTVRAACAGQVAVPQDLLDHIVPPVFSVREKQVLGMVVLGFMNQEIAAKLHLTESTVKTHLSSAYRKLGVRSRREAAALILDSRSGLGAGILTIPTDQAPGERRPPAVP